MSILDLLTEERVVSISKVNSNQFLFKEECDMWYHVTLDKKEMEQLIEELQELLKE